MKKTEGKKTLMAVILGVVMLTTGTGLAEEPGPVETTQNDKCPVCGMFVYKYPDWTAEIIYKDHSTLFFDGAKDMFKYYLEPAKYLASTNERQIAAIYVMEYYDMKMIDARKAFFVAGSDVYGPMGHELIPLATEEDAGVFLQDHQGKRIYRFKEVTTAVIEKLD